MPELSGIAPACWCVASPHRAPVATTIQNGVLRLAQRTYVPQHKGAHACRMRARVGEKQCRNNVRQQHYFLTA